jgi:hypothetical protein
MPRRRRALFAGGADEVTLVIPGRAKREPGIQMLALDLCLDSGFRPPKSAIADLGIDICQSRVNPRLAGRPRNDEKHHAPASPAFG